MSQYRANKKTWVVNNFYKRYKNGEINFDNPIQRGIVWNKKDSSLYIHSLLYNILIYQKPFLISKKDYGYDVLDGKQRGTTLIKYINNEFALQGLQNEPLIMVKGEPYQINGKFFKQLPETLQMEILDFEIEIAMLENAPVEVEALFFERSNSGRAMAKVDIARSRNRAIDTVKEIAEHEIFTVMFSEKARDRLPQDEIVVKTWQALNETEPDYSAKHYQELMENLDITEEDKATIINVYDRILEAYKVVDVLNSEVSKMMLKKTHFLSYISFVEKFADAKMLAAWIIKFYSDMPEAYINASSKQTTSVKNTAIRVDIIKQYIEKLI